MAKAKKSTIVVTKAKAVPRGRSPWPFSDLGPPNKKTGDMDVFYVDMENHQAIRTAASRAMRSLNIGLSVRKIKDKNDKEYGRIGVFRVK